ARAFDFVAVDADVGNVEFSGQVNEALGVGNAFGAFVRVGVVHFGGTAEVGNFEPVGGNAFFGGGDFLGSELGAVGEIEVTHDAADFNGGEAVGSGEIENLR